MQMRAVTRLGAVLICGIAGCQMPLPAEAPPSDVEKDFEASWPIGGDTRLIARKDRALVLCKEALDADYDEIKTRYNTSSGLTFAGLSVGLLSAALSTAASSAQGQSEKTWYAIANVTTIALAAALVTIGQFYKFDATIQRYGTRLGQYRLALSQTNAVRNGNDFNTDEYAAVAALLRCGGAPSTNVAGTAETDGGAADHKEAADAGAVDHKEAADAGGADQ